MIYRAILQRETKNPRKGPGLSLAEDTGELFGDIRPCQRRFHRFPLNTPSSPTVLVQNQGGRGVGDYVSRRERETAFRTGKRCSANWLSPVIQTHGDCSKQKRTLQCPGYPMEGSFPHSPIAMKYEQVTKIGQSQQLLLIGEIRPK
ncbi:hypothetical protein AOG23_00965 [Rhizobium acidisoli]|nr:hypothetical protein AOG23_00965 [Rhizobium acidisoli]